MKTNLFSEFRKDEGGGILAFYLVMFITMMIGGGMAIDFIRHEIKREAMQDALDRGVLAAAGNAKAASATSTAEIAAAEAAAIATVRSYIEVSGFNPDAHGVTVTPTITPFSQRVDADADFSVDTFFLSLTGIDTLAGVAAAGATVSVSKIELSLIVDISGSMGGTKIENLRTAATTFVTDMLDGDRSDFTSISLVPFSGQTSATPEMMTSYNYSRWHNFSSCVDFDGSDYTSTTLSTLTPLAQTQHFAPEWISDADSDWCPRSDISIVPYSNSIVDLSAAIGNLRATGMTAGQVGMKWGITLLDESSQPLVTSLITQNEIDPVFAGRPAAADDDETLKFAIMMTDGDNTPQYNVKSDMYLTYEVILDANKDVGESPNYHAPENVIADNGDDFDDWELSTGQRTAGYWDANPPNSNYVPWSFSHLFVRVNPTTENTRMQDICTAAKDSGIVIFTIGYDVSVGSTAYNQMRSCASSIGHFYPVETTDLSAAFASIQQAIQKLKLVN
ncbi:MAG: hypothetical protein GQ535_03710 [Rhodobacteraceae bacterium]|nr:hypothetical protein [Paracoccaceae bacterium]